jgi:enoyl-CoA hydratase
MDLSKYNALSFARRGRVLEITINRPESLNAVDAELHTELARIFVELDEDRESDVIILTGAGRAFCAGGDVNWMQDAIDDPTSFEMTCREAKRIVYSILDCEKPIIAALNGPAVGLGATLALFCDLIIADEDTYISDPHVSIGMVAGDGGAAIWPQLIGYARAKEYLLLGDRISAKEAERIGLITRTAPASDLREVVMTYANRLCSGPQQAIRFTKLSINIGLRDLVNKTIDASLAYESLTNISADHQEAVNAFREKRKPTFGNTG